MKEHIILTSHEQCQISWCKCCKNYSIVFNSCSMALAKHGIRPFLSILRGLDEEDFHYEFLGQRKALLKNQAAPIGICLTMEEAELLEKEIEKALNLNEVFEIVYGEHCTDL